MSAPSPRSIASQYPVAPSFHQPLGVQRVPAAVESSAGSGFVRTEVDA